MYVMMSECVFQCDYQSCSFTANASYILILLHHMNRRHHMNRIHEFNKVVSIALLVINVIVISLNCIQFDYNL